MASITINFVPPNPVCTNGFKVKYRKVGDSDYTIISPNPRSSPITISGIDISSSYEGSIKSDCSNAIYSDEVAFTTNPCTGPGVKLINGICTNGTIRYLSSTSDGSGGYICTYKYYYYDGTSSITYTETKTDPCPIA